MSIPTLEDRVALFNVWITSYYQHPDLASRAFSGLTPNPPSDPPPNKKPTLYRFTQAELQALTFPEALTHVDGQLRFVNTDVYKDNARKVWFDEGHAKMFPRLKMKLIWCEESILEMPYGAWRIGADVEKFLESGGKGRSLEMHSLAGNHFAHWDRPAETMELFASLA